MAMHTMMRCKEWERCKNCLPCAFNAEDNCTKCVRCYGNENNMLKNVKDNFEAK